MKKLRGGVLSESEFRLGMFANFFYYKKFSFILTHLLFQHLHIDLSVFADNVKRFRLVDEMETYSDNEVLFRCLDERIDEQSAYHLVSPPKQLVRTVCENL